MKKRMKCVISGRVQGVLYRIFVKEGARELGLKGEVENMPDGTVRADVEGEEEKLSQFKKFLEAGSRLSKVEKVICESHDDLIGYEDFRIKYRSFLDRF